MKFDPMRDVAPYVAVAGGVGVAIQRGFTFSGNEGILVISSLCLAAVGAIAIPVNLWMKKRSL